MEITAFIFGLLAILLNDAVSGEPLKQTITQNNKKSGSVAGEVIIGNKNPKRDSSDQTAAVEDKTGQSQNYQSQLQYQSFAPTGQYFQQAAAQQVHYAKPEGGIDYAKSVGGVQYASSTHRPAPAYQTISYSAQHNGLQQQNNGKIIAQITPVQYSAAPLHYYTLPQHSQQQLQYAIAVPTGNNQHQQIAFAALPGHGYHNQPAPQIVYAAQPQIGQYFRGESGGHYSAPAPIPQHHHQVPQYALIAAHQQPQLDYAKLPAVPTQPNYIYATHPAQNYFAGQSGNHGYYQHQAQPLYHPVQQPYSLAIQPAIQYSAKQVQSTVAPVSVTPAPAVQYKKIIEPAASNSNHNGATSFSTYSAQLPAHSLNLGGVLQVIKAPVAYATTAAPVATIQHNGSLAGKIYYAAIPAQYQDGGQGYRNHGAIHYGQHLYHPANAKAIFSPNPALTGQKN